MVEKRRNTHFRQKQIIAAAAELIVRHGSEHLTIKSLARHTELSEAAIYRHFSSKNDIYHLLLKYIRIKLLSDLRRKEQRNATGPSNLNSLIETHISEIEKSRGVEFQVIAEIISMGDIALNKEILRIINSYISSLEKLFQQGPKSQSRQSLSEAECLALAFFTLLQGLVNIWALSGYAFDLKHRFFKVWDIYKKDMDYFENSKPLAKGRNLKYNQSDGIGG